MTNNIVVVDTKTRFVTVSNPLIGNKGENRVTRLVMNMSEFLNGNAFLEIRRPDPNDMTQTITQYAQMEKGEKNYSIVVLNSILQVEGEIELCFHIYNESMFEGGCACEIFKSSIFKMIVGETIDAETADEVGALPDTTVIPTKTSQLENDSGFITDTTGVESVNGKTGIVELTAEDIGALPIDTTIPTKTSELTNDSGFITEVPVNSVNNKTGAVVLNAGDVGALPSTTKIPQNTTDLTNDNMIQYTAQVLNDAQKEQARQNIGAGTSNFSGSYNDLTDKPDTPGTYELPIASATTLGGVKIGNNLKIDNNGVLAVDITYNDLKDKPVIVTQLTSAATDNELVSAKCLYDTIGNVETQLASI